MVDKHRGDPKRKRTAIEAVSRAAEITKKAAAVAERKEARARFAEEVAHVGSAVARELALPRILQVILDETVLTLGAQFAQVYLTDEHQRALELVGHRNIPDDFKERLSRVSLDAPSLAARAASTRQAQMVSSIDQIDPAFELTRQLLSRMACESIVALPLVVSDRLLGVLIFAMAAPHEFTHEERVALTVARTFSPSVSRMLGVGSSMTVLGPRLGTLVGTPEPTPTCAL
jgi:transcriptional regulator with GAF, ATPase, and Fis domain